ncbi:MAG: putative aminohydrolase SsnA [bacterium]
MKKRIIKNGTLLCMSEDAPVFIDDGAVYIEDGVIKRVGKREELERNFEGDVIDAHGGIIMPGLVNCHMHLYSSLARGIQLKGKPAENFVEILQSLWWKLDRKLDDESIYYSALVGITDSIKFGTTTIFDHHASNGYVKGSLKIVAKAVREVGIRASLCYEVSDRDGEKISNDGIEENLEFIEYLQNDQTDKIKAHFGLHASFTIEDRTFDKIASLTKGLDCGFHIHCAEDEADQDVSMSKFGSRVVERLERYGILKPQTIIAHCIHINEKEMDIIAGSRAFVAHNPESNMNNGVGYAPVLELIKKGATCGLGTDGYTANMFNELRVANILPKLMKRDPRVGFNEAFRMLFTENPRFASKFFKHPVGILKENAYADIIVLPYNPPTPMNGTNAQGHCIFGFSYLQPELVMINGEIVYEKGSITKINENKMNEESRKVAEKLWGRFNG